MEHNPERSPPARPSRPSRSAPLISLESIDDVNVEVIRSPSGQVKQKHLVFAMVEEKTGEAMRNHGKVPLSLVRSVSRCFNYIWWVFIPHWCVFLSCGPAKKTDALMLFCIVSGFWLCGLGVQFGLLSPILTGGAGLQNGLEVSAIRWGGFERSGGADLLNAKGVTCRASGTEVNMKIRFWSIVMSKFIFL